ncbi:MAG: hypothetical protein C0391_08980 [Anaerolinea sp.]|nr:hypothetical protein [Anaerolinea sp.]
MQDIAVACPHCGRDYPQTGEYAELEDRLAKLDTVDPGKRIWTILAGFILLLVAISGWLYVFYYTNEAGNRLQSMESTRAAQSVSLAQNQIEMTTIAGTQLAQSVSLAQNQIEMTTIAGTQLAQAQEFGLASDLKSTVVAMKTQEAVANVTATAEMALARSHQIRLCGPGIGLEWDYTSNDTIFKQLKVFSESMGGEVTKSTYILPWTKPYLAIHQLTTANKYIFWFIVQFKNDEVNIYTNSIYWIDNNCYLDIN